MRVKRIKKLSFLALCFSMEGSWMGCYGSGTDLNALRLGDSSPVNETVVVDIHPRGELNYKSKAEILNMRRKAVQEYPELVEGSYVPSDTVFGQMEGGAPWWGLLGQFYYGPGSRSIEGPADKSQLILNPFLPISVSFFGRGLAQANVWDLSRVNDGVVSQPDFPLDCTPKRLVWNSRRREVRVEYNVSEFLDRIAHWSATAKAPAASFYLEPLNARDWDLNYLYLDLPSSVNIQRIQQSDTGESVTQILSFIHRGGTCGFPDGCNNVSPTQSELQNLWIPQLPAQLVIRLWKEAPKNSNADPDLTVYAIFN